MISANFYVKNIKKWELLGPSLMYFGSSLLPNSRSHVLQFFNYYFFNLSIFGNSHFLITLQYLNLNTHISKKNNIERQKRKFQKNTGNLVYTLYLVKTRAEEIRRKGKREKHLPYTLCFSKNTFLFESFDEVLKDQCFFMGRHTGHYYKLFQYMLDFKFTC